VSAIIIHQTLCSDTFSGQINCFPLNIYIKYPLQYVGLLTIPVHSRNK